MYECVIVVVHWLMFFNNCQNGSALSNNAQRHINDFSIGRMGMLESECTLLLPSRFTSLINLLWLLYAIGDTVRRRDNIGRKRYPIKCRRIIFILPVCCMDCRPSNGILRGGAGGTCTPRLVTVFNEKNEGKLSLQMGKLRVPKLLYL